MISEVLYVGKNLRRLRRQKLLTQERLADLSGVGVATIIRAEKNQVEPSAETIRKLAKALEVEPLDLFER